MGDGAGPLLGRGKNNGGISRWLLSFYLIIETVPSAYIPFGKGGRMAEPDRIN